jgi:hypothetical protein
MSPLTLAFRARVLIAVAVTSLLPACNDGGGRLPDYRYRLSVEVETPMGLRTGSGVIEVHGYVRGRHSIPSPGGVTVSAEGEAVAVDLPGGKTLFALLTSEFNEDWASWILLWLTPQNTGFEARYEAMLSDDAVKTVTGKFGPYLGPGPYEGDPRPRLVHFANPLDPKSVERVDPDELASAFGAGYKLRRITVQRTDEAVTAGIIKRLPWLTTHRGGLLGTSEEEMLGRPEVSNITERSFVQENE